MYNCAILVAPGGNVTKNNFMSGACVGSLCSSAFYTKAAYGNLTLAADGKVSH